LAERFDIGARQDRAQPNCECAHHGGPAIPVLFAHRPIDGTDRDYVNPTSTGHRVAHLPTMTTDTTAHQRRAAASRAAEIVRDGMVIGYGTGRAAMAVMDALALRVQDGLRVLGIPTSLATSAHAAHLGLPLTNLDKHPSLDLTIDGADEVDPSRHIIKGGGAALFREKVLAGASDRLVIVVDATKRVPRLGTTCAIPVEVLPFAVGSVLRQVTQIGGTAIRRLDLSGAPVVTDNGNHVIDVAFAPSRMNDPRALDLAMREIPGVMITGLFWSFNPTVVVGTDDGIEVLGPPL
jgi:ribose 5-phosphate isomerase A